MRILFLDIDGVLVNRRSFFIRSGNLPTCDPGCLEVLNEICEATNAHIVISSSWRLESSLRELQQILGEWGVKAPVIGVTPLGLSTRGAEIEAWIAESESHGQTISSFVILDDCSDMEGELLGRLVQTDSGLGLCKKATAKAIAILRNEIP